MLYCWTSFGFPLPKLHWSVRGRGVFYSVCIWDVWLFLAVLQRQNPFNPIHIWNLMFTSWVIVGKEGPIQPRLDPEPTLVRRPACQLLFLQISSAPGTSAGICPIETSSRALKPSSPGMIYIHLYQPCSSPKIQPVCSPARTQWESRAGPGIFPSAYSPQFSSFLLLLGESLTPTLRSP